jgi:hypothetical protein
MAIASIRSYGDPPPRVSLVSYHSAREARRRQVKPNNRPRKNSMMRNLLLVLGLLALAVGVLWIGQGTGMVRWPRTSFMINQIEWAGYGAAVAALGLVLIWQSKR